jgi:hypothetical protein
MKLSLSALLFLSLAPAAVAQEDVFTRTYVREPGAPVTVTASFGVCDSLGPFTLVVTNGPAGALKAGGATITVNGNEIVSPTDFGRDVSTIERSLSSLLEANQVGVRLTGAPGGTILLNVREVQACGVHITSPTGGSTVTGPEVLVRGTYPSSYGSDVGLTVNGFRGLAAAGRFAALVPVDPQVTALTAVARNPAGTTLDDDTIPVTVQAGPDEPAVTLQASPAVGIVPLSVEMSLVASMAVTLVQLDKDGDGVPDFQGPVLDGVLFTYPQPGVFVATATASTSGGPERASVIVQAYDRPALEGMLQARWTAMKNALRKGDVEAALLFVTSTARERYREAFEALADDLPQIDAILLPLTFARAFGTEVIFDMPRSDGGVTKAFEVRFALDADGVWRVRAF